MHPALSEHDGNGYVLFLTHPTHLTLSLFFPHFFFSSPLFFFDKKVKKTIAGASLPLPHKNMTAIKI